MLEQFRNYLTVTGLDSSNVILNLFQDRLCNFTIKVFDFLSLSKKLFYY